MNKQFSYKIVVISLIITAFITILNLYNSKENVLKSSLHNAEMVADVVKGGLTSYMLNDNMHQVDTYINAISDMKNISNIWLVRSESVNQQFKAKEIRSPRDNLDKDVLKSGKLQYSINDNVMRVSIPYNAESDCIKCHKVSFKETLGAISFEMNITELQKDNLNIIYLIPLVLMFGAIFIIYFFKRGLDEHSSSFDELSKSLNMAVNGEFKSVTYAKTLSPEMVNVMERFNNLMVAFKDTSVDIDKKLRGFIGYKSANASDSPLADSKEIISNLSNLYQFKKEIELDNTKEEIYERLSQIFINQFDIKNFTFVEIDMVKQKMFTVVQYGNTFYCKDNISENPNLCRAARTKNDVISIDFHHSCPYFKESKKYHYCLNIDISKSVTLIINFVFDTKTELEELKEKISFMKSYINEAAPSLEVKLLMEALQQSAFRDGLTGLYNRKFLDEHTKKLIPQAKRENFNIGVLLLDMDHFKAVNDEYGHDIGDKVLKELARILSESVRESDVVVRYGGEEFVVLLVNIKTEEDALAVANKIRNKVADNEIDVYAGAKLRKTISIGLSMFPDDSTSIDGVIKNADIALYEAKRNGRNRVVRFEKEQISSVDLF